MLSHACSTPVAGPWAEMWERAATGPAGYWRAHGVAEGFRTAPATGPQVAAAVAALLDEHPRITRVVELGAGDGELLTALARSSPGLSCLGVDLRLAPTRVAGAGVDGPGIGWVVDRWRDAGTGSPGSGWEQGRVPALFGPAAPPTLLIAHEWLDELPVTVLDPDGWRRVGVGPTGTELLLEPAAPDELAWAERWWPTPGRSAAGSRRVEVGASRDRAWADAIRLLSRCGGVALAVDYGHSRDTRPADGSLRAYAGGHRVAAVPDGRRNLTCDVAVDAVRAAGEAAGATTLADLSQREALHRWAGPDALPQRPLARLAARSAAAALTAPTGFGRYRWLLQARDRVGA